MTPWHHGRMAAFDVETSGVDWDRDRIVTAAVAMVGGGQPTEPHEWLLNPGIEIPHTAAKIHGITTEIARDRGLDPAGAIDDIVTHLAIALSEPCPIIAFNGRFDFTFLDREARRHGVEPLVDRVERLLSVDPLVVDKHIDRYRPGSRKLDAICGFYGARLASAHSAADDAIAAARVAWVLAEKGQIVRRERDANEAQEAAELRAEWAAVRHDLPALHEAQERWAGYQAGSLAVYFRENGKENDANGVDPRWPMVPCAA